MILKIFTVYDSKAEAYLQPFFAGSKGLAIRSFSDAANSAEHNFSRYAADFTLFELGTYDDSKAAFDIYDAYINLGSALEFRKAAEVTQLKEIRNV